MMDLEESLMSGIPFAYKLPRQASAQQSVKATQFDFDAFDESLQKQWQNDRAKKATKRQERYLKRLEAQPTKLNRKKAKRAGASETSLMSFNKSSPNGTSEPDFHTLNQTIKLFIENTARAELSLPPMEKKFRYAIHMLADTYK